MKNKQENYEQRKKMWAVLSKLFPEKEVDEFVWMFSEDDREVECVYPDGLGPAVRGRGKICM